MNKEYISKILFFICDDYNFAFRYRREELLAVGLVGDSAVQDGHNTAVGFAANQPSEALFELNNGRGQLVIVKGIASSL